MNSVEWCVPHSMEYTIWREHFFEMPNNTQDCLYLWIDSVLCHCHHLSSIFRILWMKIKILLLYSIFILLHIETNDKRLKLLALAHSLWLSIYLSISARLLVSNDFKNSLFRSGSNEWKFNKSWKKERKKKRQHHLKTKLKQRADHQKWWGKEWNDFWNVNIYARHYIISLLAISIWAH